MVTKETKLALAIVLIGGAVLGGWYVFRKDAARSVAAQPHRFQKEEAFVPDQTYIERLPEIKAYKAALRKARKAGLAFLPLEEDELDAKAKTVQEVLLHTPAIVRMLRYKKGYMHAEMMRIVPAIDAVLTDRIRPVCDKGACYQAELYNFVTNTTIRAIVDAASKKVLHIDRFEQMQPEISKRLHKVAEAIALHAPEVERKLGHKPRRLEVTMANVRGSMKRSLCEDTRKLCVAPTFADVRNARALWAVVDLTDLRLAAAKWAPLGKSATPACISERTLQNRYIMENFCRKMQRLDRDGWHIEYHLTGSDGLEIRNVTFRGKPVLRSAKIVDWHVAYAQSSGARDINMSQRPIIAGREAEFVRLDDERYMFGYNDAMGCPMFSTSVVLAFDGPQIKPLPGGDGFMVTQDFRNPKWPLACNYRYENRFEFYKDGSFRIVGVNKGRGCASHAIYRPVMRIDTALHKEAFFVRENGRWQKVSKEFYEKVRPQRYAYKITGSDGRSYLIEPNRGQFHDHSRGDHATLFVTAFHPEEGDSDMLTLGSCCKLDEDGPERFVNDETLSGDIVLWYVPRIQNDDRKGSEYCWADSYIDDNGDLKVRVWPCAVGPKFIFSQGGGE